MSLRDYLIFAAEAAEALERATARDQKAAELVATPEAERDWGEQRHQRQEAGRNTRRVWTRRDRRWHTVQQCGGVVPRRRADRIRERVREVDWRTFANARQEAAELALIAEVEELQTSMSALCDAGDEMRKCEAVRHLASEIRKRVPTEVSLTTIKEFAERHGCNAKTLQNKVGKNKLRSHGKRGKSNLYLASDLQRIE